VKLSAIRSASRGRLIQTNWGSMASPDLDAGSGRTLWAVARIRAQLAKTTVVVPGPSDFDRALVPLIALRRHYPQ